MLKLVVAFLVLVLPISLLSEPRLPVMRFEVCAAFLQAHARASTDSPGDEVPQTSEAVDALSILRASDHGLGFGIEPPTRTHSKPVAGSLGQALRSPRFRNLVAQRWYAIEREHREGTRTALAGETEERETKLVGRVLKGEQKDAFLSNFQHSLELAKRGFHPASAIVPALAGSIAALVSITALATNSYPLVDLMAVWVGYLSCRDGVPWNIGRYFRHQRWGTWPTHSEGFFNDPDGYTISMTMRIGATSQQAFQSRLGEDEYAEQSNLLSNWIFRRRMVGRDGSPARSQGEANRNGWSEITHRMSRETAHQPLWLQLDVVRWRSAPDGDQILYFIRTSRDRPRAWASEASRIRLPVGALQPSR